jgi:RNA polymerase sigma-70 factor (ECF subfamily)
VAEPDAKFRNAIPSTRRDLVARIYDMHAPRLFRYALSILADRAGAEDAIQQVFTKMLAQKREPALECPEAYLRRAVRNECYSALRSRRRNREVQDEVALLEAADSQAGDDGERRVLESALRSLPPEQREVLHLKVFEGWTFQEIATACGESINTVASRYRYAIDRIKVRLRDDGQEGREGT